jgi:hypothetical protein
VAARKLALLLPLLVLLTNIVSAPIPASAALVCGPTIYSTPIHSGLGNTCSEATANLRANATADIHCPGEVCSAQLVITGACFYNEQLGYFQVDGYIRYRCYE